ncbi:phage baseplate plug family protein [Serratia rubidaea]|uniref:phage baseplate plug family protein n=1 Tax=Serratia rubidaea TaxID=61652 RepID=UPI00177CA6A7|nr:hypothetical protein [Serratia rubidaea]MBD8451884.1 hypothetical protein [Serratia rubidaea]
MNAQEVPLTADNQRFGITLGGQQFTMRIIWRESAGWVLDLLDSAGNALVNGIPLIPGVDLLEQYRHLGITGALVVLVDDNQPELPTKSNLGAGCHLYFKG